MLNLDCVRNESDEEYDLNEDSDILVSYQSSISSGEDFESEEEISDCEISD